MTQSSTQSRPDHPDVRPWRRAMIPLGVSLVLMAGCSSSDDDGTDNDGIPSGNTSENTDELDPPAAPGESSSMPSPTFDQVPVEVENAALGIVFGARDDERTLYTRPDDAPGTVTCIDTCAASFPPLSTDVTTAGISGDFDIIERPDGTNQWTYKGYPLHRHTGDGAPSEANGEGTATDDSAGLWHVARPEPITSGDSDTLGEILVVKGQVITAAGEPTTRNDFAGRTLYVTSDDSADTSTCVDACADTWIPLYADAGAAASTRYSVFERPDGTVQWAYENQPLYAYTGDAAAGDINGEGIGGVWSVVTQ